MEIITWACFFGFVALVSFLIYNTLSKSSSEDDLFEEERAHRRKNLNNKQNQDHSRSALEKAKEKKLKKQNKKQKEKKVIESSVEENNDVAETEVTDLSNEENETPVVANKKNKTAKIQVSDNENNETKKNMKPEVKSKKDVSSPEESVDFSSSKEEKAVKKSKQTIDKGVQQIKKPKVSEKPVEDKKPVEVTEEKLTEVVEVPVQPQVIIKKEVKQVQAVQNGIKTKNTKKKKNEITNLELLKSESEAVNINLLIALVQKSELSRSENQLLIDALLNKQQEDISEWLQGRQDPLVKLKKQLMESEQALKDEKEAAVGLQTKLKELRSEINNEKSANRHMEERLVSAQNECQSYSLKLQQAIEDKQAITVQHNNCLQQIKQFQKQLSDEKLALLKLKEEHAEAEEQYHEAVRTVQTECTEYVVTSQQFQAETANLRAQLALVQEQSLIVNEEYLKSKNDIERVLSESQFQVSKLQNELSAANRELSEVREELNRDAVLRNKSELENQNLIEQNDRFSSQISTLHAELKTLRDENEILSKNCAENWENGYCYNDKQGLVDYESRLEETEISLKSVKNELDVKVNKIEELNTIILTCKNENTKKDSLLQKAQTEIDALKAKAALPAIKIIEDDNLLHLKDVITEKNKEISNLKNEIESHKQRNNELRNKNWKVVEALKQAEERSQHSKRHSEPSSTAKENNLEFKIETWVKKFVQKMEPNLVLEEKGTDDMTAWLNKVENALDTCNRPRPEQCDDGTNLINLQCENNQLQNLVEYYKKIINDTEGVLNELQNNVEIKESEWKEKLNDLENTVEQLRQGQPQCK